MSSEAKANFEHWCIVELMGHQRIAGKVSEASLFGGTLMRVDVPESDDRPAFTKFYGSSAIYAITPVEESVCRLMAKAYDQRPVEEWRLRALLPQNQLEDDDSKTTGMHYSDYDDGSTGTPITNTAS